MVQAARGCWSLAALSAAGAALCGPQVMRKSCRVPCSPGEIISGGVTTGDQSASGERGASEARAKRKRSAPAIGTLFLAS